MNIIREALDQELSDSFDCTRVWAAWHYRTMDEDDFVPVSDRMDEIVESITLHLLTAPTPIPRQMTNEASRRIAALIVARRNLALAIAENMVAEAQLEKLTKTPDTST